VPQIRISQSNVTKQIVTNIFGIFGKPGVYFLTNRKHKGSFK